MPHSESGMEREGGLEPPAICISLVSLCELRQPCALLDSLLSLEMTSSDKGATILLEEKSLWKCMCWVFIAFLNTLPLLQVNDWWSK